MFPWKKCSVKAPTLVIQLRKEDLYLLLFYLGYNVPISLLTELLKEMHNLWNTKYLKMKKLRLCLVGDDDDWVLNIINNQHIMIRVILAFISFLIIFII